MLGELPDISAILQALDIGDSQWYQVDMLRAADVNRVNNTPGLRVLDYDLGPAGSIHIKRTA